MEKKLDVSSPNEVFFGDYLRSSETDEVSSKSTSSDSSEMQENPKTTSHWRGLVELLRIKSMKPLATLHPLSVLKLSRRESKSVRENGALASNAFGDNYSSEYFTSGWNNFTLAELQNATRNFSHENLVGKGGYAEVYKGCIRGGKLVAVKRLTRGTAEESIGDFLSELGIMAHVNHPNTARLIGYGVEGGMHIVLEFSPHGSLASLLHCETGSKEKLDWSIRYKVALGTAEGLLYLHEGCKRRIIHRDIKAANILLTENFEPQICDFGLAKWLPEQWTHHTVSKFEGTFGYLAPEYLMHGIVDEKTDVFAFGVLLLELITGRRALDYSQQSLVLWAKPLLYKNKVKELVDPSLDGDYNSQQMNLAVLATSLCIKRSSIRRPQMSQVVQILKGNLSNLDCKRIRRMPCYQKALCKEHFDTEEYYSAEDFNDLNCHKQLALGF